MSALLKTALLVLVAGASVGCVGEGEVVVRPEHAGAPTVTPQVLPTTVITPVAPEDLEALYQQAASRLMQDDFKAAAAGFDKILALSPNGPQARMSLFGAGLAYLSLEERPTALGRLRKMVEQFPDSPQVKPALLRISRILSFQESWPELEKVSADLVARTDLTVLERIEALGARGLALVSQDRLEESNDPIIKARNLIEDNHLGQSTAPPVELAQVNFALGEVRRLKSEKILFVPYPPNFGQVLEERCTALLDAQDAYTEAMRSKDAHWSAMSGFRVGELYQKLHQDVMATEVPVTPTTTLQQRQLWEGAMRLRYRTLLEKGLQMMQGTVRLGERTGENSEWIQRAKDAQKQLEVALADEKQALSKMPFSEDELREALAKLKKK